jgi:aspartyl-tRNA(Asn)/glutamyl-tRNA(Gln) amidotransferase subunit B
VVQETRGWDEAKGKTTSQRSKENAQDYRYMPDPDIPPITLDEAEIEAMQADLPMLPPEYRAKFAVLEADSSVTNALLAEQSIAQLMAEIIDNSDAATARRIANLFASSTVIASDSEAIQSNSRDSGSLRLARDDILNLPKSDNLIKLSKMIGDGKLSSTAAKEVFTALLTHDDDPETIAKSKNLIQVSDSGAIEKIVDQVLASAEAAQAVADIKSGNDKAIGFLVGLVMKQSKGQANPGIVNKIIKEKI